MVRWIKFILFLIILSCTPKKGTITAPSSGTSSGGQAPAPVINSVVVSNYELIINGTDLQDVTSVTLSSNSRSTGNKSFQIISATINQIIAVGVDAVEIPTNMALNLILGNAYGQSAFPIEFAVQNGEVVNSSIQDYAITTNKIANGGITTNNIADATVTLSKLTPNPGPTPASGTVITWNGTGFILTSVGTLSLGVPPEGRHKEEIKDFTEFDAEKIIENLKVKSFKFKKDNPNFTVGFIAEDVLEIFPDAVIDEYYTLNYNSIFSTAISVIQSQQKKIRELEEGQRKLEAKLDALLGQDDK